MCLDDFLPRWDGAGVTVLTGFLTNFAGTERYTATVCEALASCGVQVEVFVAEKAEDDTWRSLLEASGITVHSAPSTGPRPAPGRISTSTSARGAPTC